ncbi:MAG: hypothetical protein ACM3XM_09195 [Mycobacterium leprae]
MKRIVALVMLCLLLLSSSVSALDSSFSPRDYPDRLTGKHFTVYYTTKGNDATTKEYAQQVLDAAEEAYTGLVTNAHFQPPRIVPVPVVLRADEESLGGAVFTMDYGFNLWMQINPKMSKAFAVRPTVAHELFHVLQQSYGIDPDAPSWVIEGMATAAPFYALSKEPYDDALVGQLSGYLPDAGRAMKEQDYMVGLFWYWLADRYGGAGFLAQVLHWAEHVEWEQAVQFSAILAGAPEDTTFDSLWRSFAFAAVNGELPKGFKPDDWFRYGSNPWDGVVDQVQTGDPPLSPCHVNAVGIYYCVQPPRQLQQYSFQLFSVVHNGQRLKVTVTGNPNTIEAYVIQPEGRLNRVLVERGTAPTFSHPTDPPTDPGTRGARLTLGKPVTLQRPAGNRTLVMVMRTGTWGDGRYQIQLAPAAADGTGPPMPQWSELSKLAGGPNSPGSPPPLTKAELAALWGYTYCDNTHGVRVSIPTQTNWLSGKVGEKTAFYNGDREVTLTQPVIYTTEDTYLFPARSIVKAFGGSAEGNRLTLGAKWVEVTPGSDLYLESGSKERWKLAHQVIAKGDELMVEGAVLWRLGFVTDTRGSQFTVALQLEAETK